MTSLPVTSDAVRNATKWLRDEYHISPDETVIELFKSEFRCAVTCRETEWHIPTDTFVEFNSEEDLTLFLLRWS